MSGIWSILLCALIFVAVIALAGLVLWLILGRGKRGEARMTGVLEKHSVFRGGSSNSGNTRPPC